MCIRDSTASGNGSSAFASRWFGTRSDTRSNQKWENIVKTSPFWGMPFGKTTSYALIRSDATIRRLSPRSNISRTFPLRTFGIPGRSSCSKVLLDTTRIMLWSWNFSSWCYSHSALFFLGQYFRVNFRLAWSPVWNQFFSHHPKGFQGYTIHGIHHSWREQAHRWSLERSKVKF